MNNFLRSSDFIRCLLQSRSITPTLARIAVAVVLGLCCQLARAADQEIYDISTGAPPGAIARSLTLIYHLTGDVKGLPPGKYYVSTLPDSTEGSFNVQSVPFFVKDDGTLLTENVGGEDMMYWLGYAAMKKQLSYGATSGSFNRSYVRLLDANGVEIISRNQLVSGGGTVGWSYLGVDPANVGPQIFAEETFELRVNVPCGTCLKNCTIGSTNGKLGSVDFSVSLGKGLFGDQPALLKLFAKTWNDDLWKRRGLSAEGTRFQEEISDSDGLRQVLVADGLADIVTINASKFEIRLYHRADRGLKNATTGLYEPNAAAAFKVIVIENSLPARNEGSISIAESENGVLVKTRQFAWSSANQQWTLNESNLRKETLSPLTLPNGDRQETRTVASMSNGVETIVSKSRQIFHRFDWGEEVIEEVKDPDGNPLRTVWTFRTEEGALKGKLSTVSTSTGEWTTYEYDANGSEVKRKSGSVDAAFDPVAPFAIPDAQCRVFETSFVDGIRTVIEKLGGLEVGRRYNSVVWSNANALKTETDVQCVLPGAPFDHATNLVTTTVSFGLSADFGGLPQKQTLSDKTIALFTYQIAADRSTRTTTVARGQPNAAGDAVIDGTRTVTVVNAAGQELSQTVTDILSAKLLTSRTHTAFDSFGRPSTTVFEDGTTETTAIGCCGPLSVTDRAGSVTTYEYDSLGFESVVTRDGIGSIQERDPQGRVLLIRRKGTDGSIQTLSTSTYDLAGRLLSTLDAVGRITSSGEIIDPSGHRIVTTTLPGGAQRIETYARDGQLLSIGGSGAHPSRSEYGVETIILANGSQINARFTKQLLIGENNLEGVWSKSYQDMAGRPCRVFQSSGGVSDLVYNTLGQLIKTVDPDGVTMLYSYNALGEREVEALDENRNGIVDYAGTDRIRKTVQSVTTHGTATVRRTTVSEWQTTGQNVAVVANQVDSTTNGLQTWSTRYGLTTQRLIALQAGGAATTTTTFHDNSTLVETSINGRPLSSTRKDSTGAQIGSVTAQYNDVFNRLSAQVDARNGSTSFTYYADDQLQTVTTPDPDGAGPQTAQITRYFYDSAGRRSREILPDGGETFTEYWPTGELKTTRGTRTYPTAYTYDSQGRLRTLTTWQDYAGNTGAAVTTWNYGPTTGLLTSKVYSDNKGPTYTYTSAGRLKTRTWARGTVTTYGYNRAGEVESTTYNDGTTPTATALRDRLGRPSTITDAAGSRAVSYTADNQVAAETYGAGAFSGLVVDPGYDALQRRNTLNVTGTTYASSFGYDNASRLRTVSTGVLTATYNRLANSELHGSVAFTKSGAPLMTTTKTYDSLNRMLSTSSANPSATVLSSTGYATNSANQRERADREDGSYWLYNYDNLGQVTRAKRYWSDTNAEVTGQQFGFSFDDIGNRRSAAVNGRASSYAANLLNQYSSRTVPGVLDVSGAAAIGTTVTANQQKTERKGEYFSTQLEVDNSTTAYSGQVKVSAVKNNAGAADTIAEDIRSVYVPATPETFSYDFDGNLTADGRFTYTWDGENRLTRVQSLASVPDVSKVRLDFKYDGQSRRIEKIVSAWSAGAYATTKTLRFVYDGWNLLCELDATKALVRSHVWGLDLSGSSQGAGGVGGLLFTASVTPATTWIPAFDGNGNLTKLINTADSLVGAEYEYGPFGDPVRATGVMAEGNPFRFSTKYHDIETGVVYYGYRYYEPLTSRWFSRDPINENGGVGLYAFVGNRATNRIDCRGLDWNITVQNNATERPTVNASYALDEKYFKCCESFTIQRIADGLLSHNDHDDSTPTPGNRYVPGFSTPDQPGGYTPFGIGPQLFPLTFKFTWKAICTKGADEGKVLSETTRYVRVYWKHGEFVDAPPKMGPNHWPPAMVPSGPGIYIPNTFFP